MMMNILIRSVAGHIQSFLSFVFITLNLLFWLPWLVLAAAIRTLIPVRPVKKSMSALMIWVYRTAVILDTWWLEHVLRIRFDVDDEGWLQANLYSTESALIICNHQSWFDVFVLQALISRHGPILKFFIKQELLWVPVLGWVCLVLDFPRFKRKSDIESRVRDRRVAEQASLKLGDETGALFLFPEGTRYTKAKHQSSNSKYKNLLRPKLGAFQVISRSLSEDVKLLDFSLWYEPGDANCWRCMSGAVDIIHLKVRPSGIEQIADDPHWLESCWSRKDSWLTEPKNSRE